MKPTDKLFDSFDYWSVPHEWGCEIENYLVRGFPPGGFHTALFANDLFTAASKSHPANTWSDIRLTCNWILKCGLPEAFGSYEKVTAWLKLTAEERQERCEKAGLLYTAWDILKSPA